MKYGMEGNSMIRCNLTLRYAGRLTYIMMGRDSKILWDVTV